MWGTGLGDGQGQSRSEKPGAQYKWNCPLLHLRCLHPGNNDEIMVVYYIPIDVREELLVKNIVLSSMREPSLSSFLACFR